MADKDIKVIIETLLKSEKFKKGLQDMNTQAQNSTKIMAGLKNMLTGLGVAFSAAMIVQAFKKVIKVGMEFEQAIANVQAVSGGAKTELEALAREAGKNTVFSARQAADAMYFLASAGLDAKDMAQVLNPTLNLAAAAQMEIAEATNMVVNQLKTFRADMKDAEKFTDIMAKTVSSANTDMQQLGDALSYAGALAAQNGISFEDLNAIIATMADQGIKGARAGVQLRMALTKLIAPTSQAQEVLAKYGITQEQINELLDDPIELFKLLKPVTQDAADATKVFGVRQQNVIGIIKDGIPRLEELRGKIGEAGGAAKKMADIQIDTLEGQLKLLKSAWEEVILQLTGDTGFNNLLKEGVTVLKDIVLAVSNFIKKLKEIKNSVAGIRTLAATVLVLKTAFDLVWNIVMALPQAAVMAAKNMIDAFAGVGKAIKAIFTGKGLEGAMEEAQKTISSIATRTKELYLKSFTETKQNIMDFYTTWTTAAEESARRQEEINQTRIEEEERLTAATEAEIKKRTDAEEKAQEAKKAIVTESLTAIADATTDFDKSAKEKLKDSFMAVIKSIAGEIRSRGIARIAASVFPPNPPGLAAGTGMVAASGVITGLGRQIVNSFQTGTARTQEGPAYLHDDERIIPAKMNIPNISNEAYSAAAMRGLSFGRGDSYNQSTNSNNQKYITISGVTIQSESGMDVLQQLEELAENTNSRILAR